VTVLTKMDPAAFAGFSRDAIASYAQDNVLSGRWLNFGAEARGRAEFDRLLPQGIDTPTHEFFVIRESPEGEAIGQIWFNSSEAGGERVGYLYNIRLEPQHRGHGHAARALALLDEHARANDVATVGLHVFALNARAQALYRAAGYGICGFNMHKRLTRDDA